MSFPLGDWQFWVATAAVFAVIALVAARIRRATRRRPGARKVSLTIEGEKRQRR